MPAQDQPDKQRPDRQADYPNLKRGGFQEGRSGNPAGRPKGKSLLAEIREVLDGDTLCGKKNPGGISTRRLLAEQALLHAIKGRSAYFKEIMERLFGKVPLRVESKDVGGEDAGDILPPHVVEAGIRAMLEAAGETGGPKE